MYTPLPQPNEISTRDKEDAMGSYLMMFAAMAVGLPLPIINLIASIIYYFVNKGKSRFVKFHCLQALLSQAPTTICNGILVFWSIRIFFLHKGDVTAAYKGYALAVLLINISYIIFSIIASIKAKKGQMYYMLLFGPIAYKIAFKAGTEEPTEVINNLPPKL
jgi:uncharacterized membrane protein